MTRVHDLPFYFLIICLCTGCAKWVSVPSPVTQVTTEGAFSNDATAEATVAGLYSRIMEGNLTFLNGGTTLYPALSADELYSTSPDPVTDGFTANAISPQNSVISTDLWGKAYACIYQVNACREGISSALSLSGGMKKQLTGEVLFMRGMAYFYLENLFGAVPLPLTSDYTVNQSLSRSDTAVVYSQVEDDLQEAEQLLKEAGIINSALRPSADACMGMEARIALYRGAWALAKRIADTLINSGRYTLEPPDRVFSAGSAEAIFSLAPVIPGVNTSEGLSFIPYDASVAPLYALTPYLVSSFEPGDLRRETWLDSTGVSGIMYYYPFKYKNRNNEMGIENNVILRLAELYLIRAEAKTRLGDLTGATNDINIIRLRAGLASLPDGLHMNELMNDIHQENRIEFFAEWGHRWLDLKRWGEADSILRSEKTGWQSSALLYPIPYGDILLNQNLTQNPGY